jgi:hypothetical protein
MIPESTKRVFLAYLDDDNTIRKTFVTLISQNETHISFETKTNRITIPISRVIKLKEEISDDKL